ncbi:phosphoethanolamine transferase CptA [Halarcobacter anaerophilus]|uniref:phosphoethanolamine transferase CptA n=1 Tax=Halarcobacter anaerophilus TaxID=877500 RepID=UPI0005CB12D6|nr:phosphoethanolamine transferase CptA [Halarcobacter anaerophilus]
MVDFSLKRFVSFFKYFLFFFYFSAVYHLLCIIFKITGTVGLRESFYMSFLWMTLVLLFNNKAKKVAAFIGIVLWLGSLFSLGYFALYGQEFSQSVIFIIFESNLTESSEFLETYFVWWLIPMVLIYSFIAFYLWKKLDKGLDIKIYKKLIFVLLFTAIPFHKFIDNYIVGNKSLTDSSYIQMKRMETATPWNIAFSYVTYRIDLANMERLIHANTNLKPLKNLEDKYKDEDTTLVLVIGESTNRNRMSLYGYKRDTTPRLQKLKKDLVLFDNVYSPRPYTIEVLQQALTFADEENPDLYLDKPNLINIMKQAGYETFWITNQQTQTKRNTMLTTFSQMCDHQVYLNNNRKQNSAAYDGAVLKPFEDVLNNDMHKKRFIVVHLLGTHNRYKYRYPKEFAIFDSKGKLEGLNSEQKTLYNEYDNAVYYNDYVVSKLIETIKNHNESNIAMLYLSDHGEEVFDNVFEKRLGRNENNPTKAMYTIPFMVYQNEKWKSTIGNNIAKNANHRLYSSSNLIYTFSDLAGIYFDDFDASKSIINKNFYQYSVYIGDPYSKNKLRDLTKKPFKKES